MCNVMLVSVSECHFPSLDDLKSKQPPSTHPPKKPKTLTHTYLTLIDISESKLLSITSYILVFLTDLCRVTSFQPQRGFVPTQKNFSKEHFSDEQQHFFQVTHPGLLRKTHTRLSSFFFSIDFYKLSEI